MIKPEEKQVRAISNLRNDISFREFVDWIENSLMTQSIANNHLNGEIAIKGQGRCLELEEILKYINNNENYIKNFKQ